MKWEKKQEEEEVSCCGREKIVRAECRCAKETCSPLRSMQYPVLYTFFKQPQLFFSSKTLISLLLYACRKLNITTKMKFLKNAGKSGFFSWIVLF